MSGKQSSDFVRGSMDLMVLSVLADEPQYGYAIQQRLSQVSGGQVALQAGTLYPLLHRLEADGLVASRIDTSTGRRRKWYRLTATGKRQLKQQALRWRAFADCLQSLLAPVLDVPGG